MTWRSGEAWADKEKLERVLIMVLNSKDLFTWSNSGVKHANTEHMLGFGVPKQKWEMQWEEKNAQQWPFFMTTWEVEIACLRVIEFEEVSRLGHFQLALKNCGNCSTQFLVHIRVKTTDGHQLTIGCWLLSPPKWHGYWSLQHNHHILHGKRYQIVKVEKRYHNKVRSRLTIPP